MLEQLNYSVSEDLLQEAILNLPDPNIKFTINEPTGRFFYDPWIIKPSMKGSVWEKILNTLPIEIGEARIITLKHGTCYHSHADIDDRYHLNVSGQYSFLVDLDRKEMFETISDKKWYLMNAGARHSAVNYGHIDRVQLVVRKLLSINNLKNPVPIKIVTSEIDLDLARFQFDDVISTWLNQSSKFGKISNFRHDNQTVFFDIDEEFISELTSILPDKFEVKQL